MTERNMVTTKNHLRVIRYSKSVVDLCREVLAAHSQCIIQSADPDDIFLNRLLEHLHTRQCIQRDQIELLKREPVSFDRCAKLLEFVSNSEGCQTFLELCNALDVFGTVNSRALADSMRKSFEDKKAMEIWAESVDHLCHEVLLAHRPSIIQSADPDDVFLNRLLDHLHARQCIQRDQIELVKGEPVSGARCRKLLDFVSSEGCQAFLELCNALDDVGMTNGKELAGSMRKSLEDRKDMEKWKESADEMCRQVLLAHRQDIIRSADPDDECLNQLVDHLRSKQSIHRDPMELTKRQQAWRGRCGKLLEFVSPEVRQAFLELCNALDDCGTINSKALADSMRTSLEAAQNWEGPPEIGRMEQLLVNVLTAVRLVYFALVFIVAHLVRYSAISSLADIIPGTKRLHRRIRVVAAAVSAVSLFVVVLAAVGAAF